MLGISYKDFIIIVNNIVNISGAVMHDFALKVAYVSDSIFEQNGYSKEKRLDLIALSFIKHIVHPSHLLIEELLTDVINSESSKFYGISKGIMDYCPEFDNKEIWKKVIQNQNIPYFTYKSMGCPEDFPKEIFTIKLAEKIVLACENLKILDNVLEDYEHSPKSDIDAFVRANINKNLLNDISNGTYKEKLFSQMLYEIPNDLKMGIIKLAFITLDFRYPTTFAHSAIMFEVCNFIADKINLQDAEKYIAKMCAYIASSGRFINQTHIIKTEEPTKEEYLSIINRQIIGINEMFNDVSILNYKQTLCHQFEYNDGSGFPLGLNSNDLNIYSKMLTIANRFCEMFEATPYSTGISFDGIFKILQHETNSGKLEEYFISAILNNKEEFCSKINKIVFAREQLYAELIKNNDENSIKDYSSLNLLVVENSDLDWLVLSKILSVYNIQADRANDGKMALDIVNGKKQYDIILMDVQMPVMNGHEATKAIRSIKNTQKASTPIYAVTADNFSGNITTCINSGMNGHFTKPIDIKKLAKILAIIYANKTGSAL